MLVIHTVVRLAKALAFRLFSLLSMSSEHKFLCKIISEAYGLCTYLVVSRKVIHTVKLSSKLSVLLSSTRCTLFNCYYDKIHHSTQPYFRLKSASFS